MKTRLAFSILILFCLSAAADNYYPSISNFSKKTYSAGPQNWSIAQDSAGNMYFANNGVLEFDSREWLLHYSSNRTAVRSVFWDEQSKRLYYGATEEFGYLYEAEHKNFKRKSLTDSLGFQFNDIWDIKRLGEELWLRENNSVFSYGPNGGRSFSFPDKVAESVIIRDTLLLFVNNCGVYFFDGEDFSELEAAAPLKDLRICAILESDKGLQLVSNDSGIFTIENGVLRKDKSPLSEELASANVYCARANDKYIAYGTVEKGVYIYNKDNGGCIHLDNESGLQNNTVLSLFFDREGSLWLGLNRGIDFIELDSPFYKLNKNTNEIGSGYASCIFEGKLWLGTNQGLYYSDSSNNLCPVPEIRGQIWSLMEKSGLLFCSCDKGIYILSKEKIQHIPLNGVWKLESLRGQPELLLGSSYDKLFLLRNNGSKWEFDGYIEGFELASKAFEEDPDGSIWFSHWVKGLFRLKIDYSSKTVVETEFFSKAQNFPQDWGNVPMDFENGIVFKTDAGFYSYNSIQNRAVPREDLNSLFVSPPSGTSIFQCKDRTLIFSSSNLQAVCRPKGNGKWQMDSLSLKALCSERILGFEDNLEIGKGMVMLNSEDGYVIIDTRAAEKKDVKNQVYIKSISAHSGDKESVIFNSRGNNSFDGKLVLPYGDYSLNIQAACPEFSSRNHNTYSFYMENYDKLWSSYNPAEFKEYTHLPNGHYVFRVRCQNTSSGEIKEASIAIEIKAPWFRQSWAYIIWGLLIALTVYIAGKLFKSGLGKHMKKIEEDKDKELKTKQLALDLERKAQDLTVSTMNLISKNEILMDIDSLLGKAIDGIGSDRNRSLSILNRIHKNIQQSLQHDDAWKKFETNFDIVYNDFLKRLKARYPQLTPTELKMCAYLKMGLSSKEIAPLLNITLRSVEMARYRLRKKLNLSRECNLSDFFDSI